MLNVHKEVEISVNEVIEELYKKKKKRIKLSFVIQLCIMLHTYVIELPPKNPMYVVTVYGSPLQKNCKIRHCIYNTHILLFKQ